MTSRSPRKNYWNLVIGIIFLGYGGFRLFTFFNGADYSTFRLIIAVGFVILGGWDLYKFFRRSPSKNEESTLK